MTTNAEIKVELAGYYRFEVGRPGEAPRLSTDWMPNLITNAGLDRLGEGDIIMYCSVGTGVTAPANTDTALATRVATTTLPQLTSTVGGAAAAPPYYGYRRTTFAFAQGAAAGNLNEVGVGWDPGGGSLFSRALIIPTVTVLSDEVLTVIYEIRKYAPTADATGSVTIAGVARTFVVRAANVTGSTSQEGWGGLNTSTGASPNGGVGYNSFNFGVTEGRAYSATAVLGAVTGTPTGGTQEAAFNTATNIAYVSGNFYKDLTISAGTTEGNLAGGVACATVQHSLGYYQCSITPVLAKDNTKTMSLTFRFSWARRP